MFLFLTIHSLSLCPHTSSILIYVLHQLLWTPKINKINLCQSPSQAHQQRQATLKNLTPKKLKPNSLCSNNKSLFFNFFFFFSYFLSFFLSVKVICYDLASLLFLSELFLRCRRALPTLFSDAPLVSDDSSAADSRRSERVFFLRRPPVLLKKAGSNEWSQVGLACLTRERQTCFDLLRRWSTDRRWRRLRCCFDDEA